MLLLLLSCYVAGSECLAMRCGEANAKLKALAASYWQCAPCGSGAAFFFMGVITGATRFAKEALPDNDPVFSFQIRVYCRLRPTARSSAICNSDGVSLALSAEDGKQHTFSFDKARQARAAFCIANARPQIGYAAISMHLCIDRRGLTRLQGLDEAAGTTCVAAQHLAWI